MPSIRNHSSRWALPQTYQRRQEKTTQRGTDFEIRMAALIYLRARRFLTSFFLALNENSVGSFDDIVLRYENDNKRQELLLQLKTCVRHVSETTLANDTGKFSVPKLFRSVTSKCIVPTCCKSRNSTCASDPGSCEAIQTYFVLFTDADVSLRSSKPNINKMVKNLLCTSGNTGRILTVSKDSAVSKSLKEGKSKATQFKKNFIIFSEQLDEKLLLELIKQEFIALSFRIVSNYKSVQTDFIGKIKDYWDMKVDTHFLTETWDEWDAIEHAVTENNALFSKVTFNDQTLKKLADQLLDHNYQKIHVTFEDTNIQLRVMKVNQSLLKRRNLRYLFTSGDEPQESVEAVLELWKKDWCDILVVDQGSDINSKKYNIDETIFQNKNKKIVFISNGKLNSSHFFTNGLGGSWKTLNEKFSFEQLDESFQNILLRKRVLLQGIEIELNDLHVKNVLTGNILTSLLMCDQIKLGRPFKIIQGPYFPRALSRYVPIKREILTLNGVPDQFYITNLSNGTELTCSDQFQVIKDDEQEKLIQQFNSENPKYPVHFLEKKEEQLYWTQTFGNPHQLYQFLDCEEEDNEEVHNILEKCTTASPKEEVLIRAGLRKLIISGEPGIGKTDLLKHASHRLKKLYPASWIITVNLKYFVKVLKEKEKGYVNKETVLRTLASTQGTDDMSKTFLNEAVQNGGNVLVLCDGFDEIYSKHCKLMFDVFNVILETKVTALWVTSQQVVLKELETCLQTKSFSLQPLAKTEAFSYLEEHLGRERSQEISQIIEETSSDGVTSIASYPMHLLMICELMTSGKWSMGCKAITLFDLYQYFINYKLQKYLQRVVKDTDDCVRNLAADHFLRMHMVCSLLTLDIVDEFSDFVRKDILKEFNMYKENISKGHTKADFIADFSPDGDPIFIHGTYAEYFAALWLNENKESCFEFIKIIMFDRYQNVLSTVLNRLLAKGHPIHLALLENDLSSLEEKLTKDTDLNCPDAGGRTPLHVVSFYHGSMAAKMMLQLLRYKPNLEMKDKLLNFTPLEYAVKGQFWDGVILLLRNGAQVENSISDHPCIKQLNKSLNQLNSKLQLNLDLENFEVNWPIFYEYKSLLHLAVIAGYGNCITMLLENHANIEMKDVNGNTPLHDAVSNGKFKAVLKLLGSKACVDVTNKLGDTPLHLASSRPERSGIVQELLRHKAKPNVTNWYGETALHIGARYGDRFLVKLLLDNEALTKVGNNIGDSPLHIAVTRKDENSLLVVSLLLQSGAPIEAINKDKNTPIHSAIKTNNFKMVELLLQHNVDITAKNKFEDTPLHMAVREKDSNTIRILLDCKAPINEKNKYGNTPLHDAVRYNKYYVELLLTNSASISEQNNEGDTPLHEAVREQNPGTVKLLLSKNASTKTVNNKGDSPLHIAVKSGNQQTINMLIDHKAPITSQNKDGNTPLHIAIDYRFRFSQQATHGDFELLKKLISDKTPLSTANNNGEMPLHLAVKRKNPTVVKLLLDEGGYTTRKNTNGDSPTSLAQALNQEEIVNILQDYELNTAQGNTCGRNS